MADTLLRKFNSAYSPSIPVTLDTSAFNSRTKQAFQKECDINTIMVKYQNTGLVGHNNAVNGRYGDFVSDLDYHSAMNDVIAADEAFASLPSSIRSRFENDPAQFLAFVHDENNIDEMKKMGLLPPDDPAPADPPPLSAPADPPPAPLDPS